MIGKQLQFGIFYDKTALMALFLLSSRRERVRVKNGIWQVVVFTILCDKLNSIFRNETFACDIFLKNKESFDEI